jgi:uncharacterized membrane protein SpoIIM required for sporulation
MGAAVLRLGMAGLSVPEGKSLGEGWLTAFAEWARVGIGIILPLLIVAAAVEVFVTPQVAVWILGR